MLKNYDKNQKHLKEILKCNEGKEENLKLYNKANEVAAANKVIEEKKV